MIASPSFVQILPLALTVAALHVAGWGAVWYYAGPEHPTLLGLAGLAYAFGLRHAFDADHIAAIDNTTRRLMNEPTATSRPLGVGLFFSLGHSTVVFVMTLAIALAATAMTRQMPRLTEIGSFIGLTVSGVFLIVIGLINLVIMVETYRTFRRMRQEGHGPRAKGQGRKAEGEGPRAEGREDLQPTGPITRLFARVFRLVTKPWHMYVVGLLFGLGFDTATEIALLAMAGVASTQSLPLGAVLALPLVFAAGMTLLDTADGVLMCGAYGWAFQNPLRKVFYNLTVTGLSVLVALFIGLIELASILSERVFQWDGVVWVALRSIDISMMGYGVVALFLLSWAGSVMVWKLGRFEAEGQRP